MRFNDGFWLLKSGVKPYWGLQVVQALPEENGYSLQVSTKPIRHRGDTLAGEHADHSMNISVTLISSRSRPQHQGPLSNRGRDWSQD